MKLKLFISILIFVIVPDNICMLKSEIIAIPGQNNVGSEVDYVKSIFGHPELSVTRIPTPYICADFGQSHCLRYLREGLEKNETEVAIYASSQGTATALNYLAHENKTKKISIVFLEGVLITGNHAIQHTLKGPLLNKPGLTALPLSYYLIPYIAKIMYPFYSPSGYQMIKFIKDIPNDIPIIIIHAKHDPQLSYEGALALYYGLKENGNNNVYLISRESAQHIRLIQSKDEKKDMQSIARKHGLISDLQSSFDIDEVSEEVSGFKVDVDLTKFQPDHSQYKNIYYDLLSKEERLEKCAEILEILIFVGFPGAFAIMGLRIYHKLFFKKSVAEDLGIIAIPGNFGPAFVES